MNDIPLEVAYPELNEVQLETLRNRFKRAVKQRLIEEMSMTVAGSDGHRVVGNINDWVDKYVF